MESFVFEGIVAAPLLPMNEDQSIDFKSLSSYYRWIAGQRPTVKLCEQGRERGLIAHP